MSCGMPQRSAAAAVPAPPWCSSAAQCGSRVSCATGERSTVKKVPSSSQLAAASGQPAAGCRWHGASVRRACAVGQEHTLNGPRWLRKCASQPVTCNHQEGNRPAPRWKRCSRHTLLAGGMAQTHLPEGGRATLNAVQPPPARAAGFWGWRRAPGKPCCQSPHRLGPLPAQLPAVWTVLQPLQSRPASASAAAAPVAAALPVQSAAPTGSSAAVAGSAGRAGRSPGSATHRRDAPMPARSQGEG